VIDLHTHTTASDGRCTPPELVARASAAGVTVLAVTDHDTVAACDAVESECVARGIAFVPGIEITACRDGADVHVLGYFFDRRAPKLLMFLHEQRARRVDRVRRMIGVLASHGIVLDADAILRPALEDESTSAGRPWIARALVAGGHVATISEAFDRWLARGRPAFIPRVGAEPADVFARVHDAGGLASLAHPVLSEHDEWIPEYAAAGLDALEAHHSKQDADATARYLSIASRLGLAVTGGSDFHSDDVPTAPRPGYVALPAADYEQFVARSSRRAAGASS